MIISTFTFNQLISVIFVSLRSKYFELENRNDLFTILVGLLFCADGSLSFRPSQTFFFNYESFAYTVNPPSISKPISTCQTSKQRILTSHPTSFIKILVSPPRNVVLFCMYCRLALINVYNGIFGNRKVHFSTINIYRTL